MGRVVPQPPVETRQALVVVKTEGRSIEQRLNRCVVAERHDFPARQNAAGAPGVGALLKNLCRVVFAFKQVAIFLLNYQPADTFVHSL